MKRPNKWLNSPVDTYIEYYGKTPNPVIYEAGSRDGNDGLELAQRIYNGNNLWQDSNIVLIECNPPQQELIKNTYPEATLIPYAISDQSGKTVEFVQMKGDHNVVGSSSMDLNRINEPWLKSYEIIKVQTKRLDEVIKELGHKEIDIMKIDIEHYTWEALQSLGKYLRSVKVYHLETEIEGIARNKTNLDIAIFMESNGYKNTALEYEWGVNIQDQTWVRI